jgi:hypothetical protein
MAAHLVMQDGRDFSCVCGMIAGPVENPAHHHNFCPVARFYAAVDAMNPTLAEHVAVQTFRQAEKTLAELAEARKTLAVYRSFHEEDDCRICESGEDLRCPACIDADKFINKGSKP